jgi:hypothetical protein
MTDHKLALEFNDVLSVRVDCEAGPEAPCHAVWHCECEIIYDYRLSVEGAPLHSTVIEPGMTSPQTHTGHFDPDKCHLQDGLDLYHWSDLVQGTVTVPVRGGLSPAGIDCLIVGEREERSR